MVSYKNLYHRIVFFFLAKKYAELSSKDHTPQTHARPKNFSHTTDANAKVEKLKREKAS